MGTTLEPHRAAAKALSHPIRETIVRELLEHGRCSPVQVARATGQHLGQVSYHVRRLQDLGVIEEDGMMPRRGAIEHYYRFVDDEHLRAAVEGSLGPSPVVRDADDAAIVRVALRLAIEQGVVNDEHARRLLDRLEALP